MRFRGLVGRGAEIGGSGATLLEEAGEHWLNHRAEHNLSAATVKGLAHTCSSTFGMYIPSLRESHPQNKNELESVVEWKPVDSVHSALEHRQEGVDNPVLVVVNIKLLV